MLPLTFWHTGTQEIISLCLQDEEQQETGPS